MIIIIYIYIYIYIYTHIYRFRRRRNVWFLWTDPPYWKQQDPEMMSRLLERIGSPEAGYPH